MKKCIKCNLEKDESEFYKAGKYLQSDCKSCKIVHSTTKSKRNRAVANSYNKKYREKYKNTPHVKAQQILDTMKARCKVRGFSPPEFTKKEIENIINTQVCSKTGLSFSFEKGTYSRSPFAASPDRIDSSKGYTKENVQWVIYIYNAGKQDFSDEEILIMSKALVENNKNKNK